MYVCGQFMQLHVYAYILSLGSITCASGSSRSHGGTPRRLGHTGETGVATMTKLIEGNVSPLTDRSRRTDRNH